MRPVTIPPIVVPGPGVTNARAGDEASTSGLAPGFTVAVRYPLVTCDAVTWKVATPFASVGVDEGAMDAVPEYASDTTRPLMTRFAVSRTVTVTVAEEAPSAGTESRSTQTVERLALGGAALNATPAVASATPPTLAVRV